MSDNYLTIEHGQVSLGGSIAPGEFVSMDVSNFVRLDRAEVDSLSGKKKVAMGWEDSMITIELSLLSDEKSTCYKKLEVLNGIFKGMNSNKAPKIYDIANPHVAARGIDQVVFRCLKSWETNEDDTLIATLEFEEYEPPTVPPEKRQAAADSSKTAAPAAGTADDKAVIDETVTKDTEGPYSTAFNTAISS